MFGFRSLSVAVASFAVIGTASAFDGYFGPEVGLFYPASAELREAFGDSWVSFGLGRVGRNQHDRSLITSDWNVISMDRGGNRLFILTSSAGMRLPLGDRHGRSQPYLAGRVGVSYMDYAVTLGSGERVASKGFGLNANAELGMQVARNMTLTVRYDVFSQRDGLTFDGLSLNLRYGFIRF